MGQTPGFAAGSWIARQAPRPARLVKYKESRHLMKLAILTIGDELLNGDLADTNTAAIAGRLMDNSLPVHEAATVGDREEEIVTSLQRLARLNDVVIATGGLGPTEDDRTARAAARAFERTLSLNSKALEQIRDRFRSWQREMHPRNEKQALLPGITSMSQVQRKSWTCCCRCT